MRITRVLRALGAAKAFILIQKEIRISGAKRQTIIYFNGGGLNGGEKRKYGYMAA